MGGMTVIDVVRRIESVLHDVVAALHGAEDAIRSTEGRVARIATRASRLDGVAVLEGRPAAQNRLAGRGAGGSEGCGCKFSVTGAGKSGVEAVCFVHSQWMAEVSSVLRADLDHERHRLEEQRRLNLQARAIYDAKAAEKDNRIAQVEADLRAELNGNMDLRNRFGARTEETFIAFVERLARDSEERDARIAQMEAEVVLLKAELERERQNLDVNRAESAERIAHLEIAQAEIEGGRSQDLERIAGMAVKTVESLDATVAARDARIAELEAEEKLRSICTCDWDDNGNGNGWSVRKACDRHDGWFRREAMKRLWSAASSMKWSREHDDRIAQLDARAADQATEIALRDARIAQLEDDSRSSAHERMKDESARQAGQDPFPSPCAIKGIGIEEVLAQRAALESALRDKEDHLEDRWKRILELGKEKEALEARLVQGEAEITMLSQRVQDLVMQRAALEKIGLVPQGESRG